MHTIIAKIIHLEANLSLKIQDIGFCNKQYQNKFPLNLSISACHFVVSIDIIKKVQTS